MKFLVTEFITTGDEHRFGITGYLACSDESERELMNAIIEVQRDILKGNKEKREVFKLYKDQIKFNRMSIDSCKLILDMYRKNLSVDIAVIQSVNMVSIPEMNASIAKFELRKLNAQN